jgi:hypothetical protein
MTDEVKKEDVNDLEYRLDYTETAIGLILASLSKKLDLGPVFEEALQEAERLKTSKSIPRIIIRIRDSVKRAEEKNAKREASRARITWVNEDPFP